MSPDRRYFEPSRYPDTFRLPVFFDLLFFFVVSSMFSFIDPFFPFSLILSASCCREGAECVQILLGWIDSPLSLKSF